jgi:hypothetical protein
MGKPEGKIPTLGRPKSRWKDKTKFDLKEIG